MRALVLVLAILAAPLAAAEPEAYVLTLHPEDCEAEEPCDDRFVWAGAGVRDGDATLVDARHEANDDLVDGEAAGESQTESPEGSERHAWSTWAWGHETRTWSGATVLDQRLGLEGRCADTWHAERSEHEIATQGGSSSEWNDTRVEEHGCSDTVHAATFSARASTLECRSRERHESRSNASYADGSDDRYTVARQSSCGATASASSGPAAFFGSECSSLSRAEGEDGDWMSVDQSRCDDGVVVGDENARVFIGRRSETRGTCEWSEECLDSSSSTRDGVFLRLGDEEHDVSTTLPSEAAPGRLPTTL